MTTFIPSTAGPRRMIRSTALFDLPIFGEWNGLARGSGRLLGLWGIVRANRMLLTPHHWMLGLCLI